VHGGIGPTVHTVKQIEAIQRPIVAGFESQEVLALLWADPSDVYSRFGDSVRSSHAQDFGHLAARDFLRLNGLGFIVRGHQCVDGIQRSASMSVVTVFSASNYEPGSANQSGVLLIQGDGDAAWRRYPPLPRMRREEALFFTFGSPARGCRQADGTARGKTLTRIAPPLPFLRASSKIAASQRALTKARAPLQKTFAFLASESARAIARRKSHSDDEVCVEEEVAVEVRV
jgi:hypothetical protein